MDPCVESAELILPGRAGQSLGLEQRRPSCLTHHQGAAEPHCLGPGKALPPCLPCSLHLGISPHLSLQPPNPTGPSPCTQTDTPAPAPAFSPSGTVLQLLAS